MLRDVVVVDQLERVMASIKERCRTEGLGMDFLRGAAVFTHMSLQLLLEEQVGKT